MIGAVVHVRDEAAGVCRAAIVVDMGLGGNLRCRVLYPAPVTAPTASADIEGWYRQSADATIVTSSDGSTRRLDSWHPAHDPRASF
jgi:hypothetical protein